MSEIKTITDAQFEETINSGDPVLVDFWAEWCGPCKMIGPIVDQLAHDYAGRVKMVKINVDQNQQTAARFRIRGIPALLLFKDGEVQATQIGATGKAQLAQMIDSVA